jgi:hypothetical protein
VLDSFAPHKSTNTALKDDGKIKSFMQLAKEQAEEKVRQELRDELLKINTVTSIIPSGGTGYLQPLDISVNKIIKDCIKQFEEAHHKEHLEEWKTGKFSIDSRRILMTHRVGKAWELLHENRGDTIRKTFQQTGLSLNPDGSEDRKIKIRDPLNVVIGDYTRLNITIGRKSHFLRLFAC